MQGGSDGDRRECQPDHSSRQAYQQSFKDRFADDDAGSRTQSQPYRVFSTSADGAHQKQSGNVDASNEQHDRNSQEQGAQQWSNIRNVELAQERDIPLYVDCSHACRKSAHDLSAHAVSILGCLRERDTILQASDQMVSPEAHVLL
jgi:hypothetical protein